VLACELGFHGLRVVTLESGACSKPSTRTPKDATPSSSGSWPRRRWERAATFDDVGNVAAFAASDQARTITRSTINIACGTTRL
jgi:3-oxoacyl-[acyl-carrier protein] reductase